MPPPHPRNRLGPSWAACPDKPAFHLAPKSGWINDPNGLAWEASTRRFHAFFQHVADGPAWAWGRLSWGHASSADGVVWRHEPVALEPSRGGPDAAGCWSGCCVEVPPAGGAGFALLFTGVSLRSGPHARGGGSAHAPPIPPAADLGLEQHECQLAAVLADSGDTRLAAWTKKAAPIIPHAPTESGDGGGDGGGGGGGGSGGPTWAGFRDPFVYERWSGGAEQQPWRLVLGSGRKGGRGCLLGYASPNPDPAAPAWVFEGEVCSGAGVVEAGGEEEEGAPPLSLDALDVGEMWECPFLVDLDAPDGRAFTLVCVSPYPHVAGAAGAGLRPTNPPIYWLVERKAEAGRGSGSGGRRAPLDLASAVVGPLRLDLGDALYAPTVPAAGGAGPPEVGEGDQKRGGVVMMAWFQELRPPHDHHHHHHPTGDASATSPRGRARDYAGCLSLARRLSVRVEEDGTPRLCQAPLAALAALRLGTPPEVAPWPPGGARLQPGAAPVPVPGAVGDAVDVEVVFERPDGGDGDDGGTPCVGLWLRPGAWRGDAPGTTTPTAVALLAHWGSGGRLEVVHVTGLTPSGCPDLRTVVRRVGGACASLAGRRCALRVLADHSAVEVFADSGEALATRVYGCGDGDGGPSSGPPRWSVFALGGSGAPAPVPEAAGWVMGVGWEGDEETKQ